MNNSFSFLGYSLIKEKRAVIFNYQLNTPQRNYNFQEKIFFPGTNLDWGKIPETLLNKALDNLLLMLGISYYKLLVPRKIFTPTIKLSREQADFWNIVYTKGLGEFFYKNKINFLDLIHFPFENNVILEKPRASSESQQNADTSYFNRDRNNRSLVFFGGGKDSIVAAELLKKHGKDFNLFVINPTKVHKQTLKILGKNSIFFERIIDPQVFVLNKNGGFYNGHIPATAINDFIGLLAAILYDYKYLISSNEKSASYGNVKYLDKEINHQWSKSLEFENLFYDYIKKFVSPDIVYFSLLRPFYEIKITELFSQHKKYFPYFSSCNTNFTINYKTLTRNPLQNWCCKCSKCLFVFILLSAFLPKDRVINIFGENLFENKLLLPTLKKLLGIEKNKPFECVGTPEETKLAFLMALQKGEYTNDILMNYFTNKVLPSIKNPKELQNKLLNPTTDNIFPKEFEGII